MPTIFYTPEKEQPWARKGSTTFNGVRLEPGINTLSEKQFKVLMEHPDYTKYVSWGAISPPADELPLFARSSSTDTSDFIPNPKYNLNMSGTECSVFFKDHKIRSGQIVIQTNGKITGSGTRLILKTTNFFI